MSSTRKPSTGQSHMPANSVFYDKVVPILIAVLAVATVVFIVIAAGVLLGFVPFK